MTPTIGQRLDDPAELFHWMNHAILSIAVLKLTVETNLCDHLGDAPTTIDELATRCAVPADKLRRIVDYLACEEVVALSPEGGVIATDRSRRLKDNTSMILVQ